MQSCIFHYVYHPCFFHFVSRKEETVQDREKRDPCWAWQEEKEARRGKHCLNNEIAKDGAFLFSCIIYSTMALGIENMTGEVNHPKSGFSPSWDHKNMYLTLSREVLCFYCFFYPWSW